MRRLSPPPLLFGSRAPTTLRAFLLRVLAIATAAGVVLGLAALAGLSRDPLLPRSPARSPDSSPHAVPHAPADATPDTMPVTSSPDTQP